MDELLKKLSVFGEIKIVFELRDGESMFYLNDENIRTRSVPADKVAEVS